MVRTRSSVSPFARLSLVVSAVLFALFVLNVVVGRVLVNTGRLDGTGISGVVEFLLLFTAVVTFTISVLAHERAADRERAGAPPPSAG